VGVVVLLLGARALAACLLLRLLLLRGRGAAEQAGATAAAAAGRPRRRQRVGRAHRGRRRGARALRLGGPAHHVAAGGAEGRIVERPDRHRQHARADDAGVQLAPQRRRERAARRGEHLPDDRAGAAAGGLAAYLDRVQGVEAGDLGGVGGGEGG
jgi:hypothetical protein